VMFSAVLMLDFNLTASTRTSDSTFVFKPPIGPPRDDMAQEEPCILMAQSAYSPHVSTLSCIASSFGRTIGPTGRISHHAPQRDIGAHLHRLFAKHPTALLRQGTSTFFIPARVQGLQAPHPHEPHSTPELLTHGREPQSPLTLQP